ncbi:MAG TPA: SDR family NAD(P)-dependent oxidoreductase [Solirubrobacteraceae bacterium]|jgi:NADP-dependent 3-hydroxy acid dehydrogenase YdfG
MTDIHAIEQVARGRLSGCGELHKCQCVVTGASAGIGQAIAVALAVAGATVFGVGRGENHLLATAEVIKGPGRITPYPADLSDPAEISLLAERLSREASSVDVLVHSAGMYSGGPVETSSADDFDGQYATNMRAPYLLTQALLPMLRASRGQIVFINSTIVFAPSANVGQFAATQHALRAFADTLREEINADGIRVASIYPGRTATPRQARIHALEGKAYAPERLLQPSDVADVVLKILTLPRSAEVTDVRIRPMLKH